MRFASLGSGSGGNATLICCGDTRILLDCGFGVRETQRRLTRLGLSVEALDAVVVTHEHSDHVKGVGALARKFRMPVYMTEGTYVSRHYGEIPHLHLIRNYQAFTVGSVQVQPVAVPHDAREPAQYIFESSSRRLGVLTDLGSITPHVAEAYAECDGLLLEANHDPVMLANGPYPPHLKARVASAWGHLSNSQAAGLLQQVQKERLQHLVVGHISRKNNSVAQAALALQDKVADLSERIHYACQDDGFDWLQIN